MTAGTSEVAAASAAQQLGEATATEWWKAAAANPGVGAQVLLPAAQGVVGEGYLQAAVSAASPAPRYAGAAVGGAGYHTVTPGAVGGLDGVSWPQRMTVEERLHYFNGTAKPTLRSRVRTALAVLFNQGGRR